MKNMSILISTLMFLSLTLKWLIKEPQIQFLFKVLVFYSKSPTQTLGVSEMYLF